MNTESSIDLTQLIKNQGFTDMHEFCKVRLKAWLALQLNVCIMPYQETQFQEFLEILEQENWKEKIADIIQKLGYDFYEYAQEELCLWWKAMIRHYKILVKYYQQKYQTETYSEAAKRFHEYEFDMIVKEDDLWAWEEAVDWIESYQELITKYENL